MHHDQLSTDPAAMERRIVEFHRGRDRYLRKHRHARHAPALDGLLDLGLPGPRRRGAGPARPRPAPLPPARPPAAAAGARRGAARGGRGVQPPRAESRKAADRRPTAGRRCIYASRAMEHADLAQAAAVCGALGSALVLLARERLVLLAGLVALALAEAGLVGALERRRPRQAHERGRRRGARWRASRCSAAPPRCSPAGPRSCRWPCWWPLPSARRSTSTARNRFFVSVAEDGRLGRLLPLYFVLAAAGARARLASAPRRQRARRCRARSRCRPRRSSPSPSSRCCGRTTSRRARTCSPSSRCRSPRCWPSSRAPSTRTGRRARSPSRRSRSASLFAAVGCGRRSRTSSSSTRPTSRSRTPTPTSSGSPRCSATRASTGATWCSASAWCSRCWPRAARATASCSSAARAHVGGAVLLLLAVEHGGAAARHARPRVRDRRPRRAARRRPCSRSAPRSWRSASAP